jgi:cysteine desulfurase
VNPHYGMGTIRFSWGRMTAIDDIEELLYRLEYIFHNFLK